MVDAISGDSLVAAADAASEVDGSDPGHVLYVANLSRQDFEFRYVPPGERHEQKLMVRAGHEEAVAEEMPTSSIDQIITQHRPYGLVVATETDLPDAFAGVCFSIDKPLLGNRG